MGLATINQLVDDKLRSASLGSELGGPLVRDRAVAQAVLQYSTDLPLEVAEDVVAVTGASFDVPEGWVVGRSRLVAVEYPIGRAPMVTLEAEVVKPAEGSLQLYLMETYLQGATVRVHFTAPHRVDTTASTVPAEHENALACWAAAELCLQLATQKGHERDTTLSAAATNGQSQSGDLARRARDWQRSYRSTLGLPDPERQAGPDAATAVVSWKSDRPRPRFFSLGH
jgi:hypothetical protein